jgi:hypothetical protein
MCSALYCVILIRIPSAALRRPVRGCASDAHYPINFVVKHPNLVVVIEKARPQAVGNLPEQSRKTERPVSRSASLFRKQKAAIGKQ